MSLLPPKVTLMPVSTSNTYMRLQNFQKLGKNAKLSKKRTPPVSGQNLFPHWCPLIRGYAVVRTYVILRELIFVGTNFCEKIFNFFFNFREN